VRSRAIGEVKKVINVHFILDFGFDGSFAPAPFLSLLVLKVISLLPFFGLPPINAPIWPNRQSGLYPSADLRFGGGKASCEIGLCKVGERWQLEENRFWHVIKHVPAYIPER